MASAEAAPAASPPLTLPAEDPDPELTEITNGLRAFKVDGKPDYLVRTGAYNKLRARTFALWDEIDARDALKAEDDNATSDIASYSAVLQTPVIGTGYQGLGPAPKVEWDAPSLPDHEFLSSMAAIHQILVPGTRIPAPVVTHDAAVNKEELPMADELDFDHEFAEAIKEFAKIKDEDDAASQDMTWFLREAEKARDDPERDNSAEAWNRVLPPDSWKAIYDTWSAEQDKKEELAAQVEAEAASKAKGKGKAKK